MEVEFIEVYKDQPLFGEVHLHMIDNGYRLLWLTRHFGSPHNSRRLGRGSLVFGEALFGLSTTRACQLPLVSFQNYIKLLSVYGHGDFAQHLVDLRADLDDRIRSELESMINSIGLSGRRRGAGSVWSSILEKAHFIVGVSAGRHNRLQTDSDRALFFR